MKSRLLTILLTCFVSVAGLCTIEWGLRQVVEPSELYGVWFWPEFNEKQFKWAYLRSHENKLPSATNHDPELGWDWPESIRKGTGYDRNFLAAEKRILFVGNSFTYGSEVGVDETFAELVGRASDKVIAINMGVPGYGIGQAVLKLEKKGIAYNPDVIVVGIHPPNLTRAALGFFSALKPRFTVNPDNGKLDVIGIPVEPPLDALNAIKKELRFESFLWASLQHLVVTRFDPVSSRLRDRTLQSYEALAIAMLTHAKDLTNGIGAKLIVLQIPHGRSFKDDKTRAALESQYPLPQLLLSVYEKLNVPYVDLDNEFMKQFSMEVIYRDLYTHPATSDVGHLSEKGNVVAAKALTAMICREVPTVLPCE